MLYVRGNYTTKKQLFTFVTYSMIKNTNNLNAKHLK